MIALFVVFTLYSLYNSVVNADFSLVYWYSGAFWSSLFGIVNKADAIAAMINGPVTEDMPASILQNHADVTVIVVVPVVNGVILPSLSIVAIFGLLELQVYDSDMLFSGASSAITL